ncbi:MAG: glutamine--fructose-6-phosphate aminotransferase [Deltaproteobacteria bacterium]|nr:MAG: glutamine--fructose-6-phosphate aminotransferase [Deltaproteobacteria bacterium]
MKHIRIQHLSKRIKNGLKQLGDVLIADIYWCRHLRQVPPGSLVLFPVSVSQLNCGLAGMVGFRAAEPADAHRVARQIDQLARQVDDLVLAAGSRASGIDFLSDDAYLGGEAGIRDLTRRSLYAKTDAAFQVLFMDPVAVARVDAIASQLAGVIHKETARLNAAMGRLPADVVRRSDRRLDVLRDVQWRIQEELIANLAKVRRLMGRGAEAASPSALGLYREINSVLNSIDRLEVRGRDSAGISVLVVLSGEDYTAFRNRLKAEGLQKNLNIRMTADVLVNNTIRIRERVSDGDQPVSLIFTYKVAAEIGALGDNIRFLRSQVRNDGILEVVSRFFRLNHTVSAHTRWASVGAISESNCHPVDNGTRTHTRTRSGMIHVCLNGDIDNYLALKKAYEDRWDLLPESVTTDTKMIPLQVQHYLNGGADIETAFRRAVSDFQGSHAIILQTDLAPGKLFLAQQGSGQAIFVGIGERGYMPTSEVYGFVEETDTYIKLDGNRKSGANGDRPFIGQIVILSQDSGGGLSGIRSMTYDGTPIPMTKADLLTTDITSRDIDRQSFSHFFLKEIFEAPDSVVKTLQGRWRSAVEGDGGMETRLGETEVPERILSALRNGSIRRIFFIGQGTAGVAARAGAEILSHYLNTTDVQVASAKASELSGFRLGPDDGGGSMADALVIAISQSGTTTDTNRSVDMVRERGGYTLAIVNRRDSDLTFNVDGVLYTSSGRDIEMSVASTKAFYSQIVATALISLHLASATGRRDSQFVSRELQALIRLPEQMTRLLSRKEVIRQSAERLAVTRTYWAAVGSGPNKATADEIRIKLSELCYKTLSSDYVEDKKHIDLSSEPLILVCAAGAREQVVGDIIKDTAIFKAHKAAPVVICDEGESRFTPYAEDVFFVPPVAEHLAPIMGTLVGHLWGYYAALAIHEGSRFLYNHRKALQETVETATAAGADIYEVILEPQFREQTAAFYKDFRQRVSANRFPADMTPLAVSDITLLLKYLSGRLPVSDFEIDFQIKGTPRNMLDTLFDCMGTSINDLSRPVDAIKHQAKTVTVGTSRIAEKLSGVLFDGLEARGIDLSALTARNVIVLKNLQEIIEHVRGAVHYRVTGLNLLGEPDAHTRIDVLKKDGILADVPSRVETDSTLQGTKRILMREGNVYIGRGLSDKRSILLIPVLSAEGRDAAIMLFNVAFKSAVPLFVKVKALGGKHERIKNIMQEKGIAWNDALLDPVAMEDLFGLSAEKIGDIIAAGQ